MRKSLCLGACTVLLLVLGSSCANDEFTGGGDDKDNDGWTADIDCDDKDENVNPGATEKENCLDDNCDGEVDEGTQNYDADKDGYCPSTGDIGDCEGNPNRHPGMAEDGGNGTQQPNGIDDNCNGEIDDGLPTSDMDGDGFTGQDGDCNDNDPLINPGAIEVEGMACSGNDECPNGKCFGGYCRCTQASDCSSMKACTADTDCSFAGETCKNGKCQTSFTCQDAVTGMSDPGLKVCRDNMDNDCDGETDEMPATCDALNQVNQADPYSYAHAIELCDTSISCGLENKCPGNLKCVGGKCSRVLLAAFNTKSKKEQRSISMTFADGNKTANTPFVPRAGQSFAILSTGYAKYKATNNTTCPQDGTDFNFKETDPDVKASDKDAFDMVELKLQIAVPTNAQSFSFDFHFLSTEYPEYVGSSFNDTFWVHLQSKKLPPGNISFDKNGTPIRINNAFFSICDLFPSKPVTQQMCTKPAVALQGTGYYKGECQKGYDGDFTVASGGSTDWLHTTAPVTPGEVITLSFMIFDKGDGILDSAVLIDNFRWKLAPASNPVTGPD